MTVPPNKISGLGNWRDSGANKQSFKYMANYCFGGEKKKRQAQY